MSGAGPVLTSHDVTERLAWETQAPLTVRPENFKPVPAKVNHEGRRARFGAAMMAPDYAWWHGFYDCKKTLRQILPQDFALLDNGKGQNAWRELLNSLLLINTLCRFVPCAMRYALLTPSDYPPYAPDQWYRLALLCAHPVPVLY